MALLERPYSPTMAKGSIEQVGNGYRAKVYAGLNPITKRQMYLNGPVRPDETAAAIDTADLLRRAEAGRDPGRSASVNDMFDQWLKGPRMKSTPRSSTRLHLASLHQHDRRHAAAQVSRARRHPRKLLRRAAEVLTVLWRQARTTRRTRTLRAEPRASPHLCKIPQNPPNRGFAGLCGPAAGPARTSEPWRFCVSRETDHSNGLNSPR